MRFAVLCVANDLIRSVNMFEHLPVVTKESLVVMIEKELGYFKELLGQCTSETPELDKAVDRACLEFKDTNPNMVKAVRACAYGVSETLKDDGVAPEIAWQAGVLTVPGVLSVLRLVDRAIESKDLERKLG